MYLEFRFLIKMLPDIYSIGEFFPMDSHNEHDLGWVLGAVAVSSHENRDVLLLQVPVEEGEIQ